MKYFCKIVIVLIFGVTLLARADGLLLPQDDAYPKDFLRNRLTRVTVKIHGLVAETIVYQEFLHEGTETTDAVYSFPLPPDARATEFLYWRNDTTFKAVLKVKEQAVNPGTGEGGVAALVNQYIGRNGIKVQLRGIKPGAIQKVQLHYIGLCDFYAGEATYKYPLDTQQFIKYPLDHLQFSFLVESGSDIIDYDIPSHPDYQIVQSEPNLLRIELIKPKAYPARDLTFWYRTDKTELGVDFFSVANDTMDGHFALFIRPPDRVSSSDILPRRIIFVLGNSSRMYGYRLDQSITAISNMLDLLTEKDYFNIIIFNNAVSPWQTNPVVGNSDNVLAAKAYLNTITTRYGSRLDLGLKKALQQITDNNYSNTILVFTEGRSPLDPREIESTNTYKAGIFPVAIGDDIDRARLEMTAALNYGFVTYIDEEENLREKMLRVFAQISQPILKDVVFEYGRADLYDILPQKLPTTYAGSYFFTTGRYKNPGKSAFSLAGKSATGTEAFNFQLDFSRDTESNKFVQFLWAKEMIDHLEREIEIYGETPQLKQQLIDLSLLYNIRCRYTAYVADYKEPFTGVRDRQKTVSVPSSYLIGNYPNPFNPTTTIRFYLSPLSISAKVKLIKIYNAMGQLVAVIDISHLEPGVHSLQFAGRDFYGNPLPSGLYFVRLQVGNEVSTIRMTLLK